MRGERVVGGLRCSEVLADLTEYVDGRLDDERRRQVEAHVAGCDNCARFGADFGKTVASIRSRLGVAPPAESSDLADRLVRGLAARAADEE